MECAGRDLRTGKGLVVVVDGPAIVAVRDDDSAPTDRWLAPGLLDLQINGLAGIHFGDPHLDEASLRTALARLAEVGVTWCLPTLITNAVDRMAACLRQMTSLLRSLGPAAGVLGFHLEGPYLSEEEGPRGAHPARHCKDPDWDEFSRLQEAAEGGIRLITLAPERRGALPFIEKAVAAGVRVAIGHTAASRSQILDAVRAGATLSTHLGNAAHDRLQRHHNYLWDQLGEDALWASLIVDGHHLPPHVVKIFARAKGLERILLISDAVQHAGLPPGVYDWDGRAIEVREDGFVGLRGEPRLAGSGLTLLRGVENFASYAEVPLADALACASIQPARFLGVDDRLGTLAPGREASFFTFRRDDATGRLAVVATYRAGRCIYRADTSSVSSS